MKKFFIWSSWQGERHPVISVLVGWFGGSLLIYALVYLGLRAATGSIELALAVLLAIAITILTLVLVAILAITWGKKERNWRIAIDEAKKFVAENPNYITRVENLIEETRETKDPVKLNKWIQDWEELSSAKANLEELEKEKEDIEKGIPLKRVDAKIEAEKEGIKELESKLA